MLIDQREIKIDVWAIVREHNGAIRLVRLYRAGRQRHGGDMLHFHGIQIDTQIKGVDYVRDDDTNGNPLEFWGGPEAWIIARFATQEAAMGALKRAMQVREDFEPLLANIANMLREATKLRDARFIAEATRGDPLA